MAEVADYTIIQTPQVRVPAVAGEMSDPVDLIFPAGGHTGSDVFVQFLYRGLRRKQAEVHLNGRRIAHIPARPSASEAEWFHHTVVVPGAVVGRAGNRLEFLRVADDDYFVANVICTFKQLA